MNPLHLIFCWQTGLLALAASLSTQVLKMSLDIFLSENKAFDRASIRSGADIRKQHPVLSQFMLPALPLLIGVALALLLPIVPPVLANYLRQHTDTPHWVTSLTTWGALCGLLGDYVYVHMHDAWHAVRYQRGG